MYNTVAGDVRILAEAFHGRYRAFGIGRIKEKTIWGRRGRRPLQKHSRGIAEL